MTTREVLRRSRIRWQYWVWIMALANVTWVTLHFGFHAHGSLWLWCLVEMPLGMAGWVRKQ